MPDLKSIYLDNAATSYPKPETVYSAVDNYYRNLGAPAGRSAYSQATRVQHLINQSRLRVANFFNAESPDRIIFTFNGTDSLNLAIHGLLKKGDHAITTMVEHNSVLRPLRNLETCQKITVIRIPCDTTGRIDPADIKKAIIPGKTKLIAVTHASNVTGTIQPIQEIIEIAHQNNVIVLVDAAQSAGHLSIDVQELGIDLLATAGHKGLLGPLGTGLLYIRPGLEEQIKSIRQGGTGSQSENDQQPEILPDKYESGNLNAGGIIGLSEGIAYLQEKGLDQLRQKEVGLTEMLMNGLKPLQGLTLFGSENPRNRLGVISLTLDGMDPQDLAAILDDSYGICSRAGFHCAPEIHQQIGTSDSGGTLRLSIGHFTFEEEIQKTIEAFSEICDH
jgi:cysteine desulfurase / selenocysteine lyase